MKKKLREVVPKERRDTSAAPVADLLIAVGPEFEDARLLKEGKWVSAEFDNDMRVDRNTHLGSGEKHVHFYDRKRNELYVMTADGKPSHGSKPFRLTKAQAAALEDEGITIPKNRMVEGIFIHSGELLISD